MATLKIGTTYNFYTKYATIVSKKVKVAALLSYDECSKYSYDIKTLAINERVISIKDEDLENEIGEDNIYLLRSTVPNADNTYNEYICNQDFATFKQKYSAIILSISFVPKGFADVSSVMIRFFPITIPAFIMDFILNTA